jgi:hypothetical protein
MEDQRRQAAEKEAAARRATEKQRASSQADANAVFADQRRRHYGRLGALALFTLPGKRFA